MASSLQVNAEPRFCGSSKFGYSSGESSETKKSPPWVWLRKKKKKCKNVFTVDAETGGREDKEAEVY